MKSSRRNWLLLLPIGGIGAGIMALTILNPSIEAQTSPNHKDARLKTRHYQASINDVRRVVEEIIPLQRKYGARWRIAHLQQGEKAVGLFVKSPKFINEGTEGVQQKIAAEVPVLFFTDYLVVTLRGEKGFTRVDIHSKSRFPGRSDLGENRRHVLQLLAALDAKFEQSNS